MATKMRTVKMKEKCESHLNHSFHQYLYQFFSSVFYSIFFLWLTVLQLLQCTPIFCTFPLTLFLTLVSLDITASATTTFRTCNPHNEIARSVALISSPFYINPLLQLLAPNILSLLTTFLVLQGYACCVSSLVPNYAPFPFSVSCNLLV